MLFFIILVPPRFSRPVKFLNRHPSVDPLLSDIDNSLQDLESAEVVQDSTISLLCEAYSIPPPKMTWLKDNIPLTPDPRVTVLENGKILQIVAASIDDAARYTCVAKNLVGESEKVFYVDVQGKQRI